MDHAEPKHPSNKRRRRRFEAQLQHPPQHHHDDDLELEPLRTVDQVSTRAPAPPSSATASSSLGPELLLLGGRRRSPATSAPRSPRLRAAPTQKVRRTASSVAQPQDHNRARQDTTRTAQPNARDTATVGVSLEAQKRSSCSESRSGRLARAVKADGGRAEGERARSTRPRTATRNSHQRDVVVAVVQQTQSSPSSRTSSRPAPRSVS